MSISTISVEKTWAFNIWATLLEERILLINYYLNKIKKNHYFHLIKKKLLLINIKECNEN